MIAMVNHQAGHAAVNADVLTGNESGLVRAKVHDHRRYVFRIADTARRLLDCIRGCLRAGAA